MIFRKGLIIMAAMLLLAVTEPPSLSTADTSQVEVIRYGDVVDLVGESRGKVVVINFWATWCGPCRQEIPELIELRQEYSEEQMVLLGISLDNSESSLARYVSRTDFNYPIYQGQNDIISAYSIMAIPRTVIYDTTGEKVLSHEGYMDRKMLAKAIDTLLDDK